MRDRHVRSALHAQLTAEHWADADDTVRVDELGLCGEVRVDVAVVNGTLSGYELKSASDTLRRLPTQVDVYSRVLDHATLVVAENHAEHSLALIPEWWGCLVADWDGAHVTLREHRPAGTNPGIVPYALAQLLWRDEALSLLERHGADRGVRSKPRTVLWQRIAERVALDDLRAEVRQCLKGRQDWRVGP
ncbi:sce7726 family protein [Occultella kanbiaonis]|uniref:sce7726 family protein n=1 Tax=Occultella kanbiaonis TaxID=2675754 RepID=UPI0012B9AA43|nr:sce7726 family protein [Occultella kanbiaonis]